MENLYSFYFFILLSYQVVRLLSLFLFMELNLDTTKQPFRLDCIKKRRLRENQHKKDLLQSFYEIRAVTENQYSLTFWTAPSSNLNKLTY